MDWDECYSGFHIRKKRGFSQVESKNESEISKRAAVGVSSTQETDEWFQRNGKREM
jgi:hypothetical protein